VAASAAALLVLFSPGERKTIRERKKPAVRSAKAPARKTYQGGCLRAPAGFLASRLPHFEQKRASSGFSERHLRQIMAFLFSQPQDRTEGAMESTRRRRGVLGGLRPDDGFLEAAPGGARQALDSEFDGARKNVLGP
jgi:hypothetical protein